MNAFPSGVTIGEKYGPAMELTDETAAREYFERCVEHTMSFGKSRDEAEHIERSNLGYYSGYYSHETRVRVERLFGAQHPILGGTATHWTPEAIIEQGRTLGRATRRS